MDKFPETHCLQRLNHEGKQHLNRPACREETESLTRNHPEKKSLGLRGSPASLTKNAKKINTKP